MTNQTFPVPSDTTDPLHEVAEHKLWETDTGVVHAETRRTLLQLLRGPYVSAARPGNLWARIWSVNVSFAPGWEICVWGWGWISNARSVSSAICAGMQHPG